MKCIKILEAFEIEIGQINNAITKPSTDDSLYWLNLAISKFVKERFNGDFVHKTSYELNEKRRNDLINLYTLKDWTSSDFVVDASNPLYTSYSLEYPNDFLFSLNEDVIIANTSDENKTSTSIFECTSDSFMYRVTNSLTDFHYTYKLARPIRVRTVSGCKLLTDKKYIIDSYTLGYLREPDKLNLDNPFNEYSDFDDITMPEIIKIAALMYLENTDNERYKTITREVSTQE